MQAIPSSSLGKNRTVFPLVILVPILTAMLGLASVANHRSRQKEDKHSATAAAVMRHQRSIYELLIKWASRNDGRFPDIPGPAEANFGAALPGGQISKSAVLVSPSGYSTAYIAGLGPGAGSKSPLLITAPTATLSYLMGRSTNAPEREHQGSVVITRLDGSVTRVDEGFPEPLVGSKAGVAPGQVRFSESFSEERN